MRCNLSRTRKDPATDRGRGCFAERGTALDLFAGNSGMIFQEGKHRGLQRWFRRLPRRRRSAVPCCLRASALHPATDSFFARFWHCLGVMRCRVSAECPQSPVNVRWRFATSTDQSHFIFHSKIPNGRLCVTSGHTLKNKNGTGVKVCRRAPEKIQIAERAADGGPV